MKKEKVSEVHEVSEVSEVHEVSEVSEAEEYIVGTWKGVPHFVCKVCGFDAFYEVVMVRHLVDKHNSEKALEKLVELEQTPSAATRHLPQMAEDHRNLGEEKVDEVFEVELVETDSAVDAQGNEHKTFTIKET